MNQVVQSPLSLDANVLLGEALSVTLVDRRQESIAFFNHFNELQRGPLAAEVWQIGLRALESAQASANAARLEDVGKALLEDVQAKLQAHVDSEARELEAQLRSYLDPKDGRLMQRLDGVLKEGGELTRIGPLPDARRGQPQKHPPAVSRGARPARVQDGGRLRSHSWPL